MSTRTTPARWVEPFFVHSFDVNHLGLSTSVTLLKMMQEAAWKHAEAIGVGFEQMKRTGLFWVLSRLQIRITRYPAWGEEFMLETWPSGIQRLLVTRDFRITDDRGIAAAATSSWIVLDVNTRRPVRPQNAFETIPIVPTDELALGEVAARVELPAETDALDWHESKPFMVRVSALDSQAHVNNARYLEWCLDAFSIDHFAAWEVREATLNFLSETHCNEEIRVRTAELDSPGESDLRTIQQVVAEGGNPSFACLLRWAPRRLQPSA